MFEQFTLQKVQEYLTKADFVQDKTSLTSLREANLPPYIISFIENSPGINVNSLEKHQFEGLLKKAFTLNLNYVIKPKATLLKFLFGKVETKPSEEIQDKLEFFQFYRYYVDVINEFIILNEPLTVSSSQISKLINEVNKKIYIEITDEETSDAENQRINLIRLLYVFFMDYFSTNSPVNKRLPKSVLSAFFYDKGFLNIKKNIDNFFKDDIFIQEAIILMKPKLTRRIQEEKIVTEEDQQVNEVIRKAKESFLSTERAKADINQALVEEEKKKAVNEIKAPEKEILSKDTIKTEKKDTKDFSTKTSEITGNTVPITPVPPLSEKVTIQTLKKDDEIEKAPDKVPEIIEKKSEIYVPKDKTDVKLYSDELANEAEIVEETKFKIDPVNKNIINEVFHDNQHKERIIRKLFKKNRVKFEEKVLEILTAKDWGEASFIIDDHFETYRIDFLSSDAIRFVDLLQNYFQEEKTPDIPEEEDIPTHEDNEKDPGNQ